MFFIKALAALLFVAVSSAQLHSCTCGGNHFQTKFACNRLPNGRMSGNPGFYRCMVSTDEAREEFLTRSCTLGTKECYKDAQPWNCKCGTYAQTESACRRARVGEMRGTKGSEDYSCYQEDTEGREAFETKACMIPLGGCKAIEAA
ncbi:hypothetical protein LZ554_007618 [Drepanopeziza brunnea f. sp. 'monogermtubi']|nr:hypothetical protein LZ554_007618 [Drepanopeziza brunnea f. sp. 'monogermtubi']